MFTCFILQAQPRTCLRELYSWFQKATRRSHVAMEGFTFCGGFTGESTTTLGERKPWLSLGPSSTCVIGIAFSSKTQTTPPQTSLTRDSRLVAQKNPEAIWILWERRRRSTYEPGEWTRPNSHQKSRCSAPQNLHKPTGKRADRNPTAKLCPKESYHEGAA